MFKEWLAKASAKNRRASVMMMSGRATRHRGGAGALSVEAVAAKNLHAPAVPKRG